MSVSTLDDMFEHELEDIYYAEHELLEALQELSEQVDDGEIEDALDEHRRETQDHVDRLEEVFNMIGEPPEEEECEGIQGLLEEHEEFVQMDPDQDILNVFNLAAAQKTEHYEIAAYGNLIPLADELGLDEGADLLEENLREEEDALEKLATLTENYDLDSPPRE
jgi:ferritin-like metal-binding protein YciE